MVIGEAPGENEDRELLPFVGKAGKLLDGILMEAGLPRDTVYVTNIVKSRPPGNRPPTKDEIAEHRPYLTEEISRIRPRFVLLLGNTALSALTIYEGGIMSRRGWIAPSKSAFSKNAAVYATLHPSAILHNFKLKGLLEEDIQQFAKRVYEHVQQGPRGRARIEEETTTRG
jgi:DNA polymerase